MRIENFIAPICSSTSSQHAASVRRRHGPLVAGLLRVGYFLAAVLLCGLWGLLTGSPRRLW